MNKLVSRNPVLRFKLGRKIGKFANPASKLEFNTSKSVPGTIIGKFKRKADRLNGPLLWIDTTTGKPLTKDTKLLFNGYNYTLKTNGGFNRGKILSTSSALPKGFLLTLDLGADLLNQILEEEIKKARASYDNLMKNYSSKITPKKNWENEFTNNFTNTLTDSQRLYLDSKGVNYTNAAEVLKFLMDLLRTDLGGYKNDGKWGKNSILAWKDFAANNIPENFDVQRNQETMTIGNTPYVEQSTTPALTLGYRTYNTYEGNDFSNRLKSMGIKSNADLIDFMHKTNGENYNWNGDSWARLFRSDVNLALGGDYSDANIRKTFNTSGNWGKGFLGRGDIGDFLNALQINAGTWNGIYDNKLQNLVKNIDWSKFKYFKQGGNLLPSRNIVERFKQVLKGLFGLVTSFLPRKHRTIEKNKNEYGNNVITTTIENRGKNPFKTGEIISLEVTYDKKNPEYNDTVYTYFPQQYISLNPKYETSNNWKTAGVSLRKSLFERLRNIFNNLNGTPKFKKFLVSGPVTTLKTGGNIYKLLNGGYTVKKGDTLSAIAKLKGVSLLKLLSWNKEIKDPNKINIGLNITIKESPIPEISKRPNDKYVPYQFKSAEKFIPNKNITKTNIKSKQQIVKLNVLTKQKELSNTLLNIKNKGKGLLLRLFGDKDIITGRTLSELKKYDAKYNTPYSLEMDKGEPVMEPYDFYGLTLYRVKLSGPEGRPEYRSKLGDLGLYDRLVNKDGNICYKIKNDKGQVVTQCAETANLINRALNLPTTGDAWTRHGVYGDSLIYGGENHNKIYTRQLSKVLNGINPSNIDPNNLKSGDFVDLMRDTKLGGKNDKLAAKGRGNTHTGTIFKPYGDRGPAYIVHNVGGPVYVDPLGKFGSLNTWSIMGIRRPGSKEHPYNK